MQNQQHKQTRFKFVIIVIIIVNMVFAYHANLAQDAPTTYVVQRGSIQDIVAFSGTWLPRDQQDLFFNIPGTIQTVNVQSGDLVATGTVLVEYSLADLQAELALAEAELANLATGETVQDLANSVIDAQFALAGAKLSLQQTLDSVPFTGINGAALSLEAAQEGLKEAQRNYNNVIGNPSNGPGAIDGAYNALKAAELGLRSAQNGYFGAAQSFNLYEYAIIGAENNLLRAELSYQQALQPVSSTVSSNATLVQDTQLRIEQLTEEIAQSSVTAPFDGVVLDVYVIRGDDVQALQEVITLALPEPLEVIAELSMEDAGRLAVSMVGVCQASGRPETAVQCIIRRLPGGNTSETVRIAADFDNNVLQGERIEVSMALGTRENVLWLPPEAIRTFQSRTFVVVQTPTGETTVDVTIGLRTADRVEILTGLNEGDIVIAPEL